jgi:hypothetical protein
LDVGRNNEVIDLLTVLKILSKYIWTPLWSVNATPTHIWLFHVIRDEIENDFLVFGCGKERRVFLCIPHFILDASVKCPSDTLRSPWIPLEMRRTLGWMDGICDEGKNDRKGAETLNHKRMARGGHGLHKVSPGPAMPNPSTPFG